jgi:hypothetical protein
MAATTCPARLLKPQEDELAQHYAVKTIENICSQGGDWAAKFCSQDAVFSLVQIYSSTKSENLKVLKRALPSCGLILGLHLRPAMRLHPCVTLRSRAGNERVHARAPPAPLGPAGGLCRGQVWHPPLRLGPQRPQR